MPSEDEVMAREEAMAAMDDQQLAAFMASEEEVAPAAAPAPEAAPSGDESGEHGAAAPAAAPVAAEPAPPAAEPAAAPAPVEEPALAAPRATPDDIEDQRKTLNAREDESLQKLMDGEITPEDHGKVKAEVRASLDKLLLAQARDQAVEEADMRVMVRQYTTDRAATAKEASAAGLDYAPTSNTGKEFDGLVSMFSKELLGRGVADTPGNLANSKEALRQAHQVMLMRHGKPSAPAAPAPAAPAAGPRPPVDRSQLPPSLANVPAAHTAVEDNRFAHINAITDPIQREAAIAALSERDYDQFMQQD